MNLQYNILDTYGAHAEILFANHLAFGIHKLIKYQDIRVFHLKTFMYNNVRFLPIPDPGSRISDPGSKNSNKREG
jgi:hypothetical protein